MNQMLRIGSRGQKARELQTVLNFVQRPSPLLMVDGIFGPNTYNAVTSFQRRLRLSADGIVGPLTSLELVKSVLATSLT